MLSLKNVTILNQGLRQRTLIHYAIAGCKCTKYIF
jgi:hypothetical protein